MPFAAPHPCKVRGCPGLTHGRYCDAHVSTRLNERRNTGRSNRWRDSAAARGFAYLWRKVSKAYLREHPFCADPHKLHGVVVVLATEVHHIIDLADGGANDEANLQALCKPCHSRITARASGWGGKHG